MTFLTLVTLLIFALGHIQAENLNYKKVVPLPETKPDTIEHAIALKFKPQLLVRDGCPPYPAIDADGNTNEGLSVFTMFTRCEEPPLGHQMYGRSTEYNGVWAIMYAYYFPRDESATPFYAGRRHGWEHAIIWLDEKSENATITAVSASRFGNRYSTNAPPESNTVDGSSAKLEKIIMLGTHHYLKDTTFPGQFYDLVMWDDLTNAAREALETTDFNTKVPIIDDNFLSNLKKADPLETEE